MARAGSTLAAQNEKQKLRRFLLFFFLALLVPMGMLLNRSYQQLERESFMHARYTAEQIAVQLDKELYDLLVEEESRSFREYSFFMLDQSPLLNRLGVQTSPLSQLPLASKIPGVLGYFQIDPSGNFSTPLLPSANRDAPSGLALEELRKRQAKEKELHEIITRNLTLLEVRKNINAQKLVAKKKRELSSSLLQKQASMQEEIKSKPRKMKRKQKGKLDITKRQLTVFDEFDDVASSEELESQERVFAESKNGTAFESQQLMAGAEPQQAGFAQGEIMEQETKADRAFSNSTTSRAKQNFSELDPTRASGISIQRSAVSSPGLGSSAKMSSVQRQEAQKRSWSKSQSFANKDYRAKRKVQVAIPQKVISQNEIADNIGSQVDEFKAQESDMNTFSRGVDKEISMAARRQATINEPLHIETFEGEIDPFYLKRLENNKILLYRRVWKSKQRYIQGLVINEKQFFSTALQRVLDLFSFYDGSIYTIKNNQSYIIEKESMYSSRSTGSRYEAVRTSLIVKNLPAPLEDYQFQVSTKKIADVPGASVVQFLGIFLIAILSLGTYMLYRTGVKQIELTQKKNDFVSAVSHELKTPLTSIRMYAEMLREGWVKDESKAKSYFDFIFFESERLSRLIGNVLELAKLSNNSQILSIQSIGPDQVLALIEQKVRLQVQASGFELDLKPLVDSPENISIEADVDAICGMFINLVDNAIKFSASCETKKIEIGCRLSQGTEARQIIELYVRDFGPGIEKNKAKEIFELFYRTEDELTRKTSGTGIGLALVRELAHRMNAKVDVSNRNPGAEFRVVFQVI